MAAVDLAIRQNLEIKQQLGNSPIFESLRTILEADGQRHDESVWQKMTNVQAKIEANQAAQKQNQSWAKKVNKAIEARLAQNLDMLHHLHKIRNQELQESEPEGVWDDFEADEVEA